MNHSSISTCYPQQGCGTHEVSTPWRNVSRGSEKPLPETLMREYDLDDVVLSSRGRETAGVPNWPRFPFPRN